uniref:Uncharacterized protein n=1 Tax=Hyaloperonospora arabidopsidis (strain Emoy2) TaxID=559515 RepID=M4B880_HYAAE
MDPLNKTVKIYVHATKINHEREHSEDPTSQRDDRSVKDRKRTVNYTWSRLLNISNPPQLLTIFGRSTCIKHQKGKNLAVCVVSVTVSAS